MLPHPPQALEAAAPKAWLLSTVPRRSRQPYEVAAAMAVVLCTMARPLAAWCAARPQQSLVVLSSATALNNVASSSCAQPLFSDVHHGVHLQWLWMQVAFDLLLPESAARATIQRHLPGLRVAHARRAWASRVVARPHKPYGSHRLLELDFGLAGWAWVVELVDLQLRVVTGGHS